jgi:hypothetical protein
MDAEYWAYCSAILYALDDAESSIGRKPTVRELDALLLS